MEGVKQQIERTKDYKQLTLEMIAEYFADYLSNKQPKAFKIQAAADDYLFLDDKTFKAFVTSPNVKFIGGQDGCNKMKSRCERLGIKINR